MGKKESKPEPEPAPEQQDERWELSRDFGPKTNEFKAKIRELQTRSPEASLPRPVHSSVYFRYLPHHQSFMFYLGVWTMVLRKMPFTNPLTRLAFWVLGVDLLRARIQWVGIADETDYKEMRCFDRLFNMMKMRQGLRVPDYYNEYEDWFEMNKPAYRVPVPHEYAMDSWMRFFAINYSAYKLRPVQWQGKWEQEMCLNMDLSAPHTDHWMDIH